MRVRPRRFGGGVRAALPGLYRGLGSIAGGKLVALVAVQGEPLANVSALRQVA